MERSKHKVLLGFMLYMIPWIGIYADSSEKQTNWKEKKPIYSDRTISTKANNFHDVLLNLVNLEKEYTHTSTLDFNVTAGAYEINVVLACSDEFEINMSTNHHDFDFNLLYPQLEIPKDVKSWFLNAGNVYGVHDVGVYVYTIKGVATGNATYRISLEYTPDHNGYPMSFYYDNENRGRPIRWLINNFMNSEAQIKLQSNETFSADYILISTQPREFSCNFWPSTSTQGNWNSNLYDISKKGNHKVTPSEISSTSDSYFGSRHKINSGIYKFDISVGSSSSSAWEMRAITDLYAASLASDFYMPKVPYFNRSNYNPDDNEDDEGEGNPIKFSYDDTGNRTNRVIDMTKSSAVAHDPLTPQRVLLDKVAEHDIKIYPNPTYGQLKVEISDIKEIKNGNILILDFNGRIILREKIDSESIDLDISNRSAGIYFMHIEIDGKNTPWKIIKK